MLYMFENCTGKQSSGNVNIITNMKAGSEVRNMRLISVNKEAHMSIVYEIHSKTWTYCNTYSIFHSALCLHLLMWLWSNKPSQKMFYRKNFRDIDMSFVKRWATSLGKYSEGLRMSDSEHNKCSHRTCVTRVCKASLQTPGSIICKHPGLSDQIPQLSWYQLWL